MARKAKREYPDDDGRTIADMSNLSGSPMMLPRLPHKEKSRGEEPQPQEGERPWEEDKISREEQRLYVLAALKAALLIALAFIVGLGLVIALLLWFWK